MNYGHNNSKLPKHLQKAIEVEAVAYALIDGGKLFEKGKNGYCIYDTDYLSVLIHAHVRVAGGHCLSETTTKIILWLEMQSMAAHFFWRCGWICEALWLVTKVKNAYFQL